MSSFRRRREYLIISFGEILPNKHRNDQGYFEPKTPYRFPDRLLTRGGFSGFGDPKFQTSYRNHYYVMLQPPRPTTGERLRRDFFQNRTYTSRFPYEKSTIFARRRREIFQNRTCTSTFTYIKSAHLARRRREIFQIRTCTSSFP